jgi:hypothetical protein
MTRRARPLHIDLKVAQPELRGKVAWAYVSAGLPRETKPLHGTAVRIELADERAKFLGQVLERAVAKHPGRTMPTILDLDQRLLAVIEEVKHAAAQVATEPDHDETDYFVHPKTGATMWKTLLAGETKGVRKLANFAATIVADLRLDDGVSTTNFVELETRRGVDVARFQVSAAHFAGMSWVSEHLGANAILEPGQTLKDRFRHAIQTLSQRKGEIPQRTIYTHTGWRLVGGERVFLHAGGALGPHGPLPGVEIQLSPDWRRYVFPSPPEGQALRQAVRASLDLIELAPPVMVPLLGGVYRVVLPAGELDHSIFLAGATGHGKSTLSALAQQHFGADWSLEKFPANWSSTENALEEAAFLSKDVMLAIDDWVPVGTQNDVAALNRKVARVLRARGNTSGRQRMTRDGQMRSEHPPRGLVVASGEDVPDGQSLRGRLLVVEVPSKALDFGVALTSAQHAGADGTYAMAMAAYITWIAARYDEVAAALPADVEKLREAFGQPGWHPRTPWALAHVQLGHQMFLRFAVTCGAITQQRADLQSKTVVARLWELGFAQAENLESADPVRRYVELLQAAVTTGSAHVATLSGSAPQPGEAYGWRVRETQYETEWQPQGRRIGWLSDNDLYLEPVAAYAMAKELAHRSDTLLSLSEPRLRKMLLERGWLETTDAPDRGGRRTTTRVMDAQGGRRRVLHLRADRVFVPTGGELGNAVAAHAYIEPTLTKAGQAGQTGHEPSHNGSAESKNGVETPLDGARNGPFGSEAASSNGPKNGPVDRISAHSGAHRETEAGQKRAISGLETPVSDLTDQAAGPRGPLGPLSGGDMPQGADEKIELVRGDI